MSLLVVAVAGGGTALRSAMRHPPHTHVGSGVRDVSAAHRIDAVTCGQRSAIVAQARAGGESAWDSATYAHRRQQKSQGSLPGFFGA
ncbi:hypothetical protein PQU63_18410 [Xanthomonas protegens]|uniref:Secreted protein n=1 Tax=Xanthomonas protegens TaxID=3380705 RepID=A0ABU9LB19_9XANT